MQHKLLMRAVCCARLVRWPSLGPSGILSVSLLLPGPAGPLCSLRAAGAHAAEQAFPPAAATLLTNSLQALVSACARGTLTPGAKRMQQQHVILLQFVQMDHDILRLHPSLS